MSTAVVASPSVRAVTSVKAVTNVSAVTNAGPSPLRSRGLDADLARSQVQLSDWVHCESASTPQGKAKIEEISAQVEDIKKQMKASQQASTPPLASLTDGAPSALLDVFA